MRAQRTITDWATFAAIILIVLALITIAGLVLAILNQEYALLDRLPLDHPGEPSATPNRVGTSGASATPTQQSVIAVETQTAPSDSPLNSSTPPETQPPERPNQEIPTSIDQALPTLPTDHPAVDRSIECQQCHQAVHGGSQ